MTEERREAKHLDEALSGQRSSADDPLVETADALKRSLAVDVPPADRTRALFLSAIGAREKRGFAAGRVLVPALGVAVLIYAVMAGQDAAPGERLWPVRKALHAVGVGEDPVEEADDHLFRASQILKEARLALDTNPGKSLRLAVTTLEYLGEIRGELHLVGDQRGSIVERIEALEDRAVDVMELALEPEEIDDNSGPGSSEADDDSSGPGSGDDSTDDSSGSGSGDDATDDSSGSGSGDSGSDDSSGSGSGDGSGSSSGSDSDDSSGSG